MAKLGPIDFTIGLPINIEVNDGKNKYEVHISKNDLPKSHIFDPKWTAATLGHDCKWA